MGFIDKLKKGFAESMKPKYIKEMEQGKPLIVKSIMGLESQKYLQVVVDIAPKYGYMVSNISQSGSFIDAPNYTVILKKVRR